MTFDVRSARVMVACAHQGSIGRAAVALNITQPTVTRILQRMEDSFGAPLFERTTTGVTVTDFGLSVLPYAELIVSENNNAVEMVRQMQGAGTGVVRFGSVSSGVERYVMPAVARMHGSVPNVAFRVVEGIEDDLLSDLKRGIVDAALLPESSLDQEIVLATPRVFRDRAAVYARPSHPVFQRERVTIEDLTGLEWALTPEETPFHREWRRRFQKRGLEPRTPIFQARSLRALISSVMMNDILICMPDSLAETEIERGLLRQVACEDLEWGRRMRVYRRKRGILPVPAATFLEHLAELASD